MCYYEPRHWKSTYSWFLGDQNSCHYGLEHLFSNELKFKWEFFYMKWYPNLGNFQKNLIISLVPHLPSYRYITLLWSAPPSDRLKAAPCSLITTHHCLPCSSFSPPFGIPPPPLLHGMLPLSGGVGTLAGGALPPVWGRRGPQVIPPPPPHPLLQ